ncbi:MAG: hypothetical protein PHU80_09350 [Kiritimatiellae bacterium]|nr:hypothetical protein [Kiritimatiellia bacterium]
MRLFFHGFLFAGCLSVLGLCAEPVGREAASAAAAVRLPQFYPGAWIPAGDYPLYDLAGTVVAYTFMFERGTPDGKASRSGTPTEFVAERRKKLADAQKSPNGNNPELYGAERFATIVISADDTEPPVIRCFLGLPPQLVKERDAENLAARGHGRGRWRVSRRLMLGMFDEAFECEDAEGGNQALLVEMRTGKTLPLAEAAENGRAKLKENVADPDRERLCREAWAPFLDAQRKEVRP